MGLKISASRLEASQVSKTRSFGRLRTGSGAPKLGCVFAMRPAPILDFGQVVAVFCYIQMVALDGFGVPLLRVIGFRSQARYTPEGIESELVAVDVVEYAHVERRGGGAFFLVAAHVNVVVVVTPVSETVNEPWIAVEGEDDRRGGGKQQVVRSEE